jgi:5-formyltetrahydrofolate cyclo-ligase
MDAKEEIRRAMLRRRREVPAPTAEAAELAVATHVRSLRAYRCAQAIVAYVATDGELATARLVAAALADGKRVYLPRLIGNEMTFAEHRLDARMRVARFGIPEPVGEEWVPSERTLILAPLVAWDRDGGRLGRGGGFYDRALAPFANDLLLVGLGYDFQQCARVPRQSWDVRLHLVVSERGAVRCRGGDASSPLRKEDTKQHDIRNDHRGQHRSGRGPGVGARLPAPATE